MKNIFLAFVFITIAIVSPAFAQSGQKNTLLGSYYNIKNALINADGSAASSNAVSFSEILNGTDFKSMPQNDSKTVTAIRQRLAADAKSISQTKDIESQREYFAGLSANLYKLVKVIKLTDQTIYYTYCPMKKSYWLSENAAVKNPYFGAQMLTCGSVKEVLK